MIELMELDGVWMELETFPLNPITELDVLTMKAVYEGPLALDERNRRAQLIEELAAWLERNPDADSRTCDGWLS